MQYKIGNLFDHDMVKETFIIHINNNLGRAGAGFVIPLYNKYPLARKRYVDWYARTYYHHRNFATFFGNGTTHFALGEIQPVKIGKPVIVNMIAQEGFGKNERPPIRYSSLALCLDKVKNICLKRDCEVICPLIGCGLANGEWSIIEQLLIENFDDYNIPLTVYQLPGEELRDAT